MTSTPSGPPRRRRRRTRQPDGTPAGEPTPPTASATKTTKTSAATPSANKNGVGHAGHPGTPQSASPANTTGTNRRSPNNATKSSQTRPARANKRATPPQNSARADGPAPTKRSRDRQSHSTQSAETTSRSPARRTTAGRRFFDTTGELRMHARGFGFVTTEDGDVYCPAGVLDGLLDGDQVTVRAWTDGDRTQASRLTVTHRPRTAVFGVANSGRLILDPGVGCGSLPIAGNVTDGAAVHGELLAGNTVRPSEVFTDVWSKESVRSRVFTRHNLPDGIPQMNAITPSLKPVSDRSRRRDLRDMVTLTIDDASSRDLDDALSVLPAEADGTLRVLIHIADVAEHVPLGSVTDAQAHQVATSIYLPGWVRPMLPPALSDDALSLHPGVERDALTVEMRLDQVGEILSVDVYESRISSNGRIDYPLAGKVLHGDEIVGVDADVAETLRWLRTAASRLSCARARRGGLSARAADPELRGETRAAGTARDLIERLMVATNESVGRWMIDRGIPTLFRVHDEPDAVAIDEISAFAQRLGFHAGFGQTITPMALAALDTQFAGSTDRVMALWGALVQRLGRARYQAVPAGHFWLASPSYVHFTSPIRRYADLVVHRLVKAYLADTRSHVALSAAAGGDLEVIGAHITERAAAASNAERDVRRILAAAAVSEVSKRRVLDAEVVSIDGRGVTVWINDPHAQATLDVHGRPDHLSAATPAGAVLRIGSSVRVNVVSCDIPTGRIVVRVAERRTGR
jgi:ribonuclease R